MNCLYPIMIIGEVIFQDKYIISENFKAFIPAKNWNKEEFKEPAMPEPAMPDKDKFNDIFSKPMIKLPLNP